MKNYTIEDLRRVAVLCRAFTTALERKGENDSKRHFDAEKRSFEEQQRELRAFLEQQRDPAVDEVLQAMKKEAESEEEMLRVDIRRAVDAAKWIKASHMSLLPEELLERRNRDVIKYFFTDREYRFGEWCDARDPSIEPFYREIPDSTEELAEVASLCNAFTAAAEKKYVHRYLAEYLAQGRQQLVLNYEGEGYNPATSLRDKLREDILLADYMVKYFNVPPDLVPEGLKTEKSLDILQRASLSGAPLAKAISGVMSGRKPG